MPASPERIDPFQVVDIKAATSVDKEVAIARYSTCVAQCKRMARKKSAAVVAAAFTKVQHEMGGLGANNKIDYTHAAGGEAREGQLLCTEVQRATDPALPRIARPRRHTPTRRHTPPTLAQLIGHFGALKNESRALRNIQTSRRPPSKPNRLAEPIGQVATVQY